MMASYLEFGLSDEKGDLIKPILEDMRNDRVFDIPADPEYQYLRGCYMNSLFEQWGVTPGFAMPDYPGLYRVVKPQLEGLSLRQITTIVIFVTHHHSSTLGLALVKGAIELGILAQGLCDILMAHVEGSVDWDELDEREVQYDSIDYCRNVCCTHVSTEYPVKLDARCPILQDLEKYRRFSQFPDEAI